MSPRLESVSTVPRAFEPASQKAFRRLRVAPMDLAEPTYLESAPDPTEQWRVERPGVIYLCP